jgi:hypothetical protein
MTTDTYSKDKRAAITWIGGVAAVLFTGALSFLATQLVAHETRITVLQEKAQSQEQRLEKMDAKLDKILDRLPNK